MYKLIPVFIAAISFFTGLALANDYIIGDGDRLNVSVWKEPDLSDQVIVRPDGKITLPAIGDVVAAGKFPQTLAFDIERELRRVVKEPIVTLTVVEVTNNNVFVAGGGVPSAVVPLTGRLSLFKFLCRFSTFENADLKSAYVMRNGEIIKDNFYSLFIEGDFSQDIALLANDIVFIPNHRDNKVYVVGAVKEPKYIYYRNEMKILDAILEAGGFTEYADQSDVVVIRKLNVNQPNREIEADIEALTKGKGLHHNIVLQPGDYIVVSEGIF